MTSSFSSPSSASLESTQPQTEGGELVDSLHQQSTRLSLHEINYEFFENFSSEHTKVNYQNDLKQFFQFLREQFAGAITSVRQIRRAHIIAFRKYLEKEGGKNKTPAAPKTIIRKMAGLSRYWKHLQELGIVALNVCDGVTRPKMSVKFETLDFSNEQASNLQEISAASAISGLLHRAVLAVLFGTGMRKAELISLKRSSYQKEKHHQILKFKVKGNKWHKVPLSPMITKHLDAYLDDMKRRGREITPDEALFQPMRNNTPFGGDRKPLSPTAVDYIVKHNAKKLGIDHKVSPHSVRATVIGHLIEEGNYSLDEIARFVNHQSVDTTRMYDKRKKNLDQSPVFGNKLVT